MVAETAVMGKPGQKLKDDLDKFESDISQDQCNKFFADLRGLFMSQLLDYATT